jgi:DNA-binding transcriptional LysR family regulator
MNLAQLRHLIALAEHGSFTNAAKHANLTQPALSRSITQLEGEFGGALVDRIGRRNEITPFGRVVLEHARQVLFQADELQRSVKLQTRGDGGELRLGLGSTPSELLIEPLLSHMVHHRPATRLTLTRGVPAQQIEALRACELDAVVLELSTVVPMLNDLHIDPLPGPRVGFLCRHGHPLALRKRLEFSEILPWPLISTFVSENQIRQLISRYGPQAHPSKCMCLVCDDIGPTLRTVAASDAVYLGSLAPARSLIQQGALVELPLRPRLKNSCFAIVRLNARSVPPALELVRTLILDLMSEAAMDFGAELSTANT